MAEVPQTLSAVTATLSQDFRPRVVATTNRRSVALRVLSVESQGGKNVYWAWEGTGQNAETFADGAAVANTAADTQNAATLPWARYRSSFGVTGDAEDAAVTSTSPREGLRLIARNMLRGIRAMASLLNGHLFSGASGGNNVVGMDTAFRNDNTYATVDRTSGANSGFRGNLIDPGVSTPPTMDLIRNDIGNTIYTQSDSEGPDVGFCKPDVFYKLANLFDPNRRYNQDVVANLNSGRQVVLDGSVGAINIEGCVFMKDKDATANRIYYVNTGYARVLLLPQAPPQGVVMASEMPSGQLNDGGGVLPYQLRVRELPNLGDEKRVTMIMKPALQIESPITCGMRINVATT